MTAETDFYGIPIRILNKKLDVELHNILVEKGKPLEETGIEPISIYCAKKILSREPGQMDGVWFRRFAKRIERRLGHIRCDVHEGMRKLLIEAWDAERTHDHTFDIRKRTRELGMDFLPYGKLVAPEDKTDKSSKKKYFGYYNVLRSPELMDKHSRQLGDQGDALNNIAQLLQEFARLLGGKSKR